MQHCPRCNKIVASDITYCPYCGSRQRRKSPWLPLIIGLVLLVGIGAGTGSMVVLSAFIGQDTTPPTVVPTPPGDVALAASPTATLEPTALPAATAEQVLPSATPTPLPTVPPLPPPFPQQDLAEILQPAGGAFGVIVYDVTQNRSIYAENTSTRFRAAGLINLPIAITAYMLAQEGQLDMSEQLTMQASDIVGGTGVLQRQPPGTDYSILTLCELMLSQSDNTASNMVLRRIGGFAVVNGLMEQLGARQTQIQRYLMDTAAIQAGRDNWTSPADMLLLLQLIEQGSSIGQQGKQDMLAAMAANRDRTKIPAHLPSDALVYNRTGTLPAPNSVEHDVALIVMPDGQKYIVVLMGQNVSSQKAVEAIAQASRLIFDHRNDVTR